MNETAEGNPLPYVIENRAGELADVLNDLLGCEPIASIPRTFDLTVTDG